MRTVINRELILAKKSCNRSWSESPSISVLSTTPMDRENSSDLSFKVQFLRKHFAVILRCDLQDRQRLLPSSVRISAGSIEAVVSNSGKHAENPLKFGCIAIT